MLFLNVYIFDGLNYFDSSFFKSYFKDCLSLANGFFNLNYLLTVDLDLNYR